MSLLNKKILVSGCGLSWGSQERKTWVNILKIGGASIIDVGGPAVSNQWIINQSILQAMSNRDITHVVIQLTSIGKLDVETTPERIAELVVPDQLRNFTFNGIWPSSHSTNHPAKQLSKKWLSSPSLELEDIFCKLVLFSEWCCSQNIKLLVFQGYPLPWTEEQLPKVKTIIADINKVAGQEYQTSSYYAKHDHTNQNTVPCLDYQFELANYVSQHISSKINQQVLKIKSQYFKKHDNTI
jgi:hypothetical protein